MATTLSSVSSDNMMDSLNTDIGQDHKLILFTSGDVEVATMTYSAANGVVGVGNPIDLTYAHGNYTDDINATGGTVDYAVIQTSGSTERVRFSDPTNDISLSSLSITNGDTVDVNVNIVVKMPNHTT